MEAPYYSFQIRILRIIRLS